jgi:hypothetical protein
LPGLLRIPVAGCPSRAAYPVSSEILLKKLARLTGLKLLGIAHEDIH